MPPDQEVPCLLWALDVQPLVPVAKKRLEAVDAENLATLVVIAARPEFVPRAIQLYEESASFSAANTLATDLIRPLAGVLQGSDIEALFQAAADNRQILYSKQLPSVLLDVASGTRMPVERMEELLWRYQLVKKYSDLASVLTEYDAIVADKSTKST